MKILSIRACNWPSASDGLVLSLFNHVSEQHISFLCPKVFALLTFGSWHVQFSGFCPWQKIKSSEKVLLWTVEVQETVVGLECAETAVRISVVWVSLRIIGRLHVHRLCRSPPSLFNLQCVPVPGLLSEPNRRFCGGTRTACPPCTYLCCCERSLYHRHRRSLQCHRQVVTSFYFMHIVVV